VQELQRFLFLFDRKLVCSLYERNLENWEDRRGSCKLDVCVCVILLLKLGELKGAEAAVESTMVRREKEGEKGTGVLPILKKA
jgi:hypothetical protein